MVNQRELTEEGLEKNFATNTLGKIFFFFGFSEIRQFRNENGPSFLQFYSILIFFRYIHSHYSFDTRSAEG